MADDADKNKSLYIPTPSRNDNYDEWAKSIRLALLSRRKFGFVNGTIMEPEAPFTMDDWLTIHSILVSWQTIAAMFGPSYEEADWNGVERLKARLVIFSNHQVVGIDYAETFAPVAKMVTVRAFLAIGASKIWELHQMDVHDDFLHEDLNELAYASGEPLSSPESYRQLALLDKAFYFERIALSLSLTVEAEYRSMAFLTCELKWLKDLLLTLGIQHPDAIGVYCDIQLADIFTKPLGIRQFHFLLSKLDIYNPYVPT
ncbi:hypothetical protein LIER_06821 [Lithospermum erythrorhizon]|uniref:PH domain-containing protein n=1 Tax=Lithospermum erythrorhizon TaxID=34254 RepID=A0AAV3P6M7_LITER